MSHRRHSQVLIAVVFALFTVTVCAQTLTVIDADDHTTTFTAARIAAMSHVTVNALDHDAPAQFSGVAMSELLSAAGIPVGDKLRGPRMADVVLVEAADGYKVVFALAEFDPAFATRDIILADKRDGKPLDAKEGPYRIVVPGDKRPARWIRQVTGMKVVAVK